MPAPADHGGMAVGGTTLGPSQDAAIVLALADTAVPFASSPEDEAERWVRVLRLHGLVGTALQSLGVGEAPLETTAQPASFRLLRKRPLGEDIVEIVSIRAHELAAPSRRRRRDLHGPVQGRHRRRRGPGRLRVPVGTGPEQHDAQVAGY